MKRTFVAACLLIILIPLTGTAEVWNISDDFSAMANPAGVWSFGWRSFGPFILYVQSGVDWSCGELDIWCVDVTSDHNPNVAHNPYDYVFTCALLTYPSNGVTFHPGPTVEQSVIRWTAPYAMTVTITTMFTAIDFGSSSVHVSLEGAELFSGYLSGLGATAEFTQTLAVQAGDVVDCAVSPGSYICDTVLANIVFENPVSVQEASWSQLKALYR